MWNAREDFQSGGTQLGVRGLWQGLTYGSDQLSEARFSETMEEDSKIGKGGHAAHRHKEARRVSVQSYRSIRPALLAHPHLLSLFLPIAFACLGPFNDKNRP